MKKEIKEVVTVPSMALSTEVLSQVDMKLSKSDLVDMVIEERRAQLDVLLQTTREENEAIGKQIKDFKTSCGEELKKAVLSEYSALTKAFKAKFPKATVTVDAYIELRADPRSRNRNDEEGVIQYFESSARLRVWRQQYDNNTLSIHGDFSKSVKAEKEKIAATLVASYKDVGQRYSALNDEVARLSKRGATVRAELTKKILEQTEQGRAILANVEALKKSVKL
jgi:predicted  nucleic acid-binding Zn-ribbon protein